MTEAVITVEEVLIETTIAAIIVVGVIVVGTGRVATTTIGGAAVGTEDTVIDAVVTVAGMSANTLLVPCIKLMRDFHFQRALRAFGNLGRFRHQDG